MTKLINMPTIIDQWPVISAAQGSWETGIKKQNIA